MKKFLIFLVSIVVVVCLGLTTYYFLRNDEIISVATKELYCNAGETFSLDKLGIKIERAKKTNKTTFNYNAGGENVTKHIKFNTETNVFEVNKDSTGGNIVLVIGTSNPNFSKLTVNVHIGNGSQENPYYVFNESTLLKIGEIYGVGDHYKLMADITLTTNFDTPIANDSLNGFTGSFDGNGKTISGLNLVGTYNNAGLFSTIESGAQVKNLTIVNATINGAYNTAGVLAGSVNGQLEKIVVKNSTITNGAENSYTGAIAGKLNDSTIIMSSVDNSTLNINSTSAVVGGLVGRFEDSIAQATYVNNTSINAATVDGNVGGYAGEYIIKNVTNSIQQSYANTALSSTKYGAFVGSVVKDFESTNQADMLNHFIGNIAVVANKTNASEITDADLVNSFDQNYFKNISYPANKIFFDEVAAQYMIRGYVSAQEVGEVDEYVFYALSTTEKEYWDTTYVWNTSASGLPTLKMTSINPQAPSGDYFRKDLTQKFVTDLAGFTATFANAEVAANSNVKLMADIDLTQTNWTPIALTNVTLDGKISDTQNATIIVTLNKAVDGQLGLFTILNNSSIKNVNIIVKDVTASATNAGAVAGQIMSSTSVASSINNVKVTYQGFASPTIANFGGIAGTVANANVENVTVEGLNITSANITNAAGITTTVDINSNINNAKVNAVIKASANAGAIATVNNGTISNTNAEVTINQTGDIADAKVGGVVAVNNGNIQNCAVSGAAITIANNDSIFVGGVAAENNGVIANVKNTIATIGNYVEGKSAKVAGVVAINTGNVSKVLTTSNVYGNYVAGVVVTMNNADAVIDQVVVGIKQDSGYAQNEIKGDIYVAGIVAELTNGTITNVQATSSLYGTTSKTEVSLVALHFPKTATLKNAVIDSKIGGFGKFYYEVMTKTEGTSNNYNLYWANEHHGCMQSVVINTSQEGVNKTTKSKSTYFLWWDTSYDEGSSASSYVIGVDNLNKIELSEKSYSYTYGYGVSGNTFTASKKLMFNKLDDVVWTASDNGIALTFVNSL